MKSFIRDFLITFLLAIVIYAGLRGTIKHSVVVSPSMVPSLVVGQHLVINLLAYKFHEPQRGDIVVFHPVNGQQGDYIKRIVGLPGETVDVRGGVVYLHLVDGSTVALKEPYIISPAMADYRGRKIPQNEYFMMGDNRNNSGDSREGWTVPRRNIIGKAGLSIWPPEKWGLAANYPLQREIGSATSQRLLEGSLTP